MRAFTIVSVAAGRCAQLSSKRSAPDGRDAHQLQIL
jgi:hypothetical protein